MIFDAAAILPYGSRALQNKQVLNQFFIGMVNLINHVDRENQIQDL